MTTILAVKKDNQVAIAGDGQVTMGENVIMKHSAKKVRTLYHGKVVTGFAGSVSDAITLFEKFENHLESTHGNLTRAAVQMAKEWRGDAMMRNLEAMLIVANKDELLVTNLTVLKLSSFFMRPTPIYDPQAASKVCTIYSPALFNQFAI